MPMRKALTKTAVVLAFGVLAASCEARRIQGIYSDGTGTIVLELKRGGAARFTESARSEECKYSVRVDTIPVSCPGGEHVFAVAQDGSLTTLSVTGALKKMP
jgi:hypothetical protein